jgi:DUF438 domain-containing protein
MGHDKEAFYAGLLDSLTVAVTYCDAAGVVRYLNRASQDRPSAKERAVGLDIATCHRPASNSKIAKIFNEFKAGRREAHHYLSRTNKRPELVCLIPIFEEGRFVGCLSQVSPLDLDGPERTFD